MKTLLNEWHSDKLKTAFSITWLLTVFFCFFGGMILNFRIGSLFTIYPFRLLVPLTALLYLIWAVRKKQNPWKTATFAQKTGFVMCAVLMVYCTLSLRRAIDFSYTLPTWLNLCFELVYFALMMILGSDRKLFVRTVYVALIGLLLQILLGIYEVFFGGIFSSRYSGYFMLFGKVLHSPAVATGNPNDFSMMLIFVLALVLFYWAWQGHKEKFNWAPIAVIAPIYFLIRASGGRLCEMAFWILMAVFVLCILAIKGSIRSVLIPVILTMCVTFGILAFSVNDPMDTLADVTESVSDQETVTNSKEIFTIDEETGKVQANTEESDGIRLYLLMLALDCFVDSKGMGVGLGNTPQIAKAAAQTGEIWAIHCFIARMTGDCGIWFLIPLMIIAIALLVFGVKYAVCGIKSRDLMRIAQGVLYLAIVVIYPIASTASGDAQNCLPMWLYLGGITVMPIHLQKAREL